MNNVVIVGAGKEGKGTFGDIFYENNWNITFGLTSNLVTLL